jgi:hypothetical protein
MDCGHDMSNVMSCSMNCCETPDRPLVTSHAFVLPQAAPLAGPAVLLRTVEMTRTMESPRYFEPLSPPPRFATSVL